MSTAPAIPNTAPTPLPGKRGERWTRKPSQAKQQDAEDAGDDDAFTLLHGYASTAMSLFGFAWQARMMPLALSSGSRASSTAIATSPDVIFTLHTPQVPTRQENSGSRWRAPRRVPERSDRHGILADLLFFENVTSGPVAGAVGLAGSPGGGRDGLGCAERFGLHAVRRDSELGEDGLDRVHHRWRPAQVDSPRSKIGNRLREQFLGDASAGPLPVRPFRAGHRDRDVQLRIRR